MFKRTNQVKAGALLSYVNLALSSIIPFIYTPIMLRLLGEAEYGLYSLSSSVIAYLSLLSFGFGSTIIRYISKYRAEGNKKAVEETFGFFLLLYSCLAVIVLIFGIIISRNVNRIFDNGLTNTEVAKMRYLILIMSFNSALAFPISVFSSMITAYDRHLFRKLVDMLATIAAPLVNLIALYLGYASVGMAVASTAIQFIMLPLNIGYCKKILHLTPQFTKMPRNLICEMLGFSAFVFIGAVVDMLFWATDKVILGMLTGTTAVAVYNIGVTFNNMVVNLSTSISGVLVPKITGMVVTNTPKEEWSLLFIKVGRLQFLIVALIVSGFSVFGQCFIELWAGVEYADAFWVAVLTMFPLCIPLIQNTGISIVTAQNKHQFRSIVYLVIAVANVISTYMVVPYWGIIGAAACSCVSYLLGQGIIMNIYYYKVTGIDIPLFWINILKMSVVPIIMMITGIILLQYINCNNWCTFFVGVILYFVIYIILMYRFCMNGYEKDVIRKPVFKIWNHIRGKNE